MYGEAIPGEGARSPSARIVSIIVTWFVDEEVSHAIARPVLAVAMTPLITIHGRSQFGSDCMLEFALASMPATSLEAPNEPRSAAATRDLSHVDDSSRFAALANSKQVRVQMPDELVPRIAESLHGVDDLTPILDVEGGVADVLVE